MPDTETPNVVLALNGNQWLASPYLNLCSIVDKEIVPSGVKKDKGKVIFNRDTSL
ncbi:MAG: hypothetical protein O7B32_04120 [Thaumarchaeota archaeon]|nr:hypothetical protein [Nitrososphaerota archaeon]